MKAKNDKAPDAANVGAMAEHTDEQINALNVKFCLITATKPQVIGKVKELDSAGNMITQTAGNLIAGHARNVTFDNMADFAELLKSAPKNQVLTASTHNAKADNPELVIKDAWHKAGKPSSLITRSKEHLIHAHGVGGLLIVDCDDMSTSKAQLLAALNEVIPLASFAHVYTTSSSSFIYNKDTGAELAGLRGQRVYIAITDQSDIKRAGDVLTERLWLAGHGYYVVHENGDVQPRTLADKSLFNPTHLDFFAGSTCHEPLEQRRSFDVNEGKALDTKAALLDLSDGEKATLKALHIKARELVRGEALLKRDKHADARARVNLARQGIDLPTSEQMQNAKSNVLRAIEGKLLTGDQIITLKSGDEVTVGELLLNPALYHGQLTLDPIEPDYDGGRVVGRIYLYSGRPNIYSKAHGGRVFYMIPQPQNIEHRMGENASTTRQTLELMRALPEYYDMGDQLIKIGGGHVISLDADLLSFELGMVAQYTRQTAKGEMHIDPPEKVVRQIIAHKRGRNLKQLNAVITAPTITHDGYIVQKRGHDEQTGLYLSTLDDYAPIKQHLTIDDAIAAYHELMKPFGTFNFATDLDRSVCLSAILTAVVRPTLTNAAGFAFDAPKQGSGKTFLAECLGLLATGERPAMTTAIKNNEDEIRKVLLSLLLRATRVIVWDNLMGDFDSGALGMFFTAPMYSGRVLGRSEQIEIPNRALFLVTGNNITLAGELGRRIFTCRLDTGHENPSMVIRDLSATGGLKPDAYIEQNRPALVSAALTIISAYQQSAAGMFGEGLTADVAGSFHKWDALARQPIVWLAEHIKELTDPKQSIDTNLERDPEQETIATILCAVNAWKGSTLFKARELLDYVASLDSMDFGGDDAATDLSDALAALCGGKGVPTSAGLGNALRHKRDRVAGNLKLILAKESTKGNLFKVIEIDQ